MCCCVCKKRGDGAVSDIVATQRALIDASQVPLSVVIVGIGIADFSKMQFLDDLELKPPARDITQFVEFNRHRSDKSSLTASTLDEIPTQVVDYFVSKGLMPNAALKCDAFAVPLQSFNDGIDTEIDLQIDNINENEIRITGGNTLCDQTSYGVQSNFLPTAVPVPVPCPRPSAPPI